MTKEKINLKKSFENSIFNKGEFYVKVCFTIFFVVLFVISFFFFNGYKYFYSVVYADGLKGYNFQIHAIDVEQGDCFLIKLPSNECMLIDAGEEKYSSTVCEYIQQFFYEENLNKIDYLLLTHPDSDHIGGAKDIMKNFEVKTLLRPPLYSILESEMAESDENFEIDDSLIYDQTIMYAYEKELEIKFFEKGMNFNFDGLKVEFLSPKLQSYSSSNNYSAVVMFSYQTKKFLFMGDAEKKIESELITEYGSYLKSDVLKVGHHGSITSSSKEFIDIVSPSYSIISSGGNSEYFPNSEVVERLKKSNSTILQTSLLENFVIGIKNNEIVFNKAYRAPNYIALIFSIVLIAVFIIWENPFKNIKEQYFTKKASN